MKYKCNLVDLITSVSINSNFRTVYMHIGCIYMHINTLYSQNAYMYIYIPLHEYIYIYIYIYLYVCMRI